jgi:hypothetical protein
MRHSISLLIAALLLGTVNFATASTRTATPSIDIELLPDFLQPGEEYDIRYSTSEPGYVVLYAIDTRGYVNLLFPLSPQLDGDGVVLPNQEYSLPGVVAGVRSGRERIVALFTRNHMPIPENRWEFLSRDPDDIDEINYHLTRHTSGLSNFNLALLQVGYRYQGATSSDYEVPQQVEVVHVYLYTPDPWTYYSGYHYSWWWHYDRYWYPHRYRYWRVSWHPWYGPFYDPFYGPWHYSWYDPWYYHHHGYYARGGCHQDGWWDHSGNNYPSNPDPPAIPRRLDRRRHTAFDPAQPDNSRIVAIPPANAITELSPAVIPFAKPKSIDPVTPIGGKKSSYTNGRTAEQITQPPATVRQSSKRKRSGSTAIIVPQRPKKSSSPKTTIRKKKSSSSGSSTPATNGAVRKKSGSSGNSDGNKSGNSSTRKKKKKSGS